MLFVQNGKAAVIGGNDHEWRSKVQPKISGFTLLMPIVLLWIAAVQMAGE